MDNLQQLMSAIALDNLQQLMSAGSCSSSTEWTVRWSQSSSISLPASPRMNLLSMILEAAVLKPFMDLALMVVSLTSLQPRSASCRGQISPD